MTWISDLIGATVTAFQTLLAGLGSGIVGFFQSLLLSTDGEVTTVTTFGIFAFVLLGLGFGFAIVTKVMNMIKK